MSCMTFSQFGEAALAKHCENCDDGTNSALSFNFHPDPTGEEIRSEMAICELDSSKSDDKDVDGPEEEEVKKTIVPAMTAEEFNLRVCSPLEQISNSYALSARRYEAMIEKSEETIKVCKCAKRKIKKTKRHHSSQLNETFGYLVRDMKRVGLFRPTVEDKRPVWK